MTTTTTTTTTATITITMITTLTIESDPPPPILPITKRALDSPEILYAIGECIPLFEGNPGVKDLFNFKPQALLNCCLVSKFWHRIMLPFMWRIDDTRAMVKVPWPLLIENSRYVRTYVGKWDRWGYNPYEPPPPYSQLRTLIMASAVKGGKVATRMIRMNKHIRTLSLYNIPLFEHLNTTSGDGGDGGGEGDVSQDNTFSLTDPLGHLQTVLEELTVDQAEYKGMEFYYLLRSVASGCLRTLQLTNIRGTCDLGDLVFESVTWLHLWLDDKMQPGLHEIVGRSPHLEHLELDGPTYGAYSLEPLVHIMRGTRPEETPREQGVRLREGRPAPRLWSRPQLKTLRFFSLHLLKTQGTMAESGNDVMFLDLIRACGPVYNKHNEMVHPGSLRELHLPLWVLDYRAREAIEVHRSTLEVLKIKTLQGRANIPSWKVERQGRVLRRMLQSCTRLKELEFWDQHAGLEVPEIMQGLLGDFGVDDGNSEGTDRTRMNENGGHERHEEPESSQRRIDDRRVRALECPELTSLVLKSVHTYHTPVETYEEEEKRFFDNENNSNGGGDSVGAWVMPKQKWDSAVMDGTSFLMNAQWDSFELFEDVVEEIGQENEGDELLKRFFRHVSPCGKLRELQLGQLRFVKDEPRE